MVQKTPHTRLTFACIGLTIGGFFILVVTSYLEYIYSLRPSTLLCVYLGISTLLDLGRTRTLFFLPESRTVASILLASYVVKVLMLIVENVEFRNFLRPEWKDVSEEETAGVINRSLFVWLNHIFVKGFKSFLTVDMLTPLDSEMLSATQPFRLQQRWGKSKCFANFLFSFIVNTSFSPVMIALLVSRTQVLT